MLVHNPVRGATLSELTVALGLTTILIAFTFYLLNNSLFTWRKVTQEQGASEQLLKAESWLTRDLSTTAYTQLRSADGLSSLNGKDGDALWFLSAVDPSSGEFVRRSNGSPMWQRNILYYSVIPNGIPSSEFQGSGISDSGYEVSHPYKILVRKVIDSGSPTDPSVPDSDESLITDITPYLETPTGMSLSAPNSETYGVVARDLLSFRVNRNDSLEQVVITLQAAQLEQRQKEFPIGSRSLLLQGYLLERRLELYPENKSLPVTP